MGEVVTAPEIARALGVSGLTFRKWLRSQWRSGHPMLAHHRINDRWEFSQDEAETLKAEFNGAAPRPTPTRKAEPSSPKAGQAVRSEGPGHRVTEEWIGEETETLADLLRPGLRGVVIGINPAPPSVAAGHYYQGRLGQGFFRRLEEAEILPPGPGFEDDRAFEAGLGFTDVVKRPSRGADEVSAEELRHGRTLLEAKLERLQIPRVIFTFKKAAVELLGDFEGNGSLTGVALAGAAVFVMPGPMESAATAVPTLRQLATWWRRDVG